MNKQMLQNEIVKTLADAGGHPLLQDVLLSQVKARMRPIPAQADFDDGMDNLKRLGFIKVKENELDPENPYWILDERGEAHALRNGW